MLCVLVVVAPTRLTAAAQADTSDDLGTTFVALHGESQAHFVPGGDALWRPDASTTVSTSGGLESGVISVHVAGSDDVTFTFAAPTGQSLRTGRYTNARDVSARTSRSPGIAASYDGRTCQASGDFTILRATADLGQLEIAFELECDGNLYHDNPTHDYGEIRINGGAEAPGVFMSAHRMDFPATFPNTRAALQHLVAYNTGADPVDFSAAISSPDDAFRLENVGCHDGTNFLDECRLDVVFEPHTAGDHTGEVTVTDSRGAVHRIPLHGAGIMAHTSWTSVIEDDAFVKPAGTYDLDPATVWISTSLNQVWVDGGRGDVNGQRLELSGPVGSRLQAGDTYEADENHPFSRAGDGPSLFFDRGHAQYSCFTWVGHFTVHQAVYVDDELKRFSATYAARCHGVKAAGSVMGSVAFNATEPALPVPAELARDTVPPGPVTDLTLTPTSDGGELHWTPPADDDYENAVWCLTAHDLTPTVPPPDCRTDPAHQIDNAGVRPFGRGMAATWTVWNRDYWGNLSLPASIHTQGSRVTLDSEPSTTSDGPAMRLSGDLTDLTHHALGGRSMAIYVGKGMDDLGMADEYADEPSAVYVPWKKVATLRTASDGTFSGTFPIRPGLFYEARFFGEGLRTGNHSRPVVAAPPPSITLSASQERSARTRLVRLNARELRGQAGDRVTFQRLMGGSWHRLAVRPMPRTGRASVRYAVRPRQRVTFRAVLRAKGHPVRVSRVLRVRLH